MTPSASTHLSKHHRLPGEIIRHAVWRYCRFPLRHRDVEASKLLCAGWTHLKKSGVSSAANSKNIDKFMLFILVWKRLQKLT